jgi:predicted ATPase
MPSNALDYITIKGFKSIASIERLPLRPVNVVIGANGSGKSNFIGAFAFLYAVSDGGLDNYVAAAGGADKILHFGSKATKQIELRLSFRDGLDEYEVALSPTTHDGLYFSTRVLRQWNKDR